AIHWIGTGNANTWTGSLIAGQATTVAFTLRDSELASTVKVPGTQGAVILAIQSQFTDTQGALTVTGGTVVGTTLHEGVLTTLVRMTDAGLKLLRLTGTGNVAVNVSIAGDLNRDGHIDGADSAAFEQDAAATNLTADLDG